VHLKVLASEFVLELHAFDELQVETSVAACVQPASCSALHHVMHDAHEYLKRGSYHLLPQALDLTQSTERQVLVADQATHAEEDPCIQASGQYILCQDRYIMEVEMQNRRYRDMLFHADDTFLLEEKKQEMLVGTVQMEHEGYDRMEAFYKARESSLRAEIADLKDKVGDFGLRNDYLDNKVLELEDRIECERVDLRELREKEKQRGIRKLYLETRCDMLEKEIIEANVATAHKYRHLVEYMKYTEFHKRQG
jgi:hypothetical protein